MLIVPTHYLVVISLNTSIMAVPTFMLFCGLNQIAKNVYTPNNIIY